jgi:hypothetical protein
MKRLSRILLNAATATSLLLFIATIVFWVRSYRSTESATYCTRHRLWAISTVRGGVALAAAPRSPYTTVGWEASSVAAPDVNRPWHPTYYPTLFNRLGFYRDSGLYATYSFDGITTRGWVRRYAVPFWFLCLTTALAPASRALRHASKRRRSQPGRCPKCGYDLRATPNRCPECGTIPAAKRPKGQSL